MNARLFKTLVCATLFILSLNIMAGDLAPRPIQIPEEVLVRLNISDDVRAMMRGGDIVGNGGGLAEQNFRHAYRKLPILIEESLVSPYLKVSKEERVILKEIAKVARSGRDNRDVLIFLSGKRYPGFFQDVSDPQVRVAKTIFEPAAPIFINLDQVYDSSTSQPSVDYPSSLAILIHELGHQVGVRSHSSLDDLGSKFRSYISSDSDEVSRIVGEDHLTLSVLNLQLPRQRALMTLSFGDKLFDLAPLINNSLNCSRTKSRVVGYRAINLHMERAYHRGIKQEVFPFRAWLLIYCQDQNMAIWSEDVDSEIDVVFEKNPDGHLVLAPGAVSVDSVNIGPGI